MKKAIILAGGRGIRLRPSTFITNKHLLPIYSDEGAIPMIFYPITTLVKSGLRDILVISSKEHCGHIIDNLGDGNKFGANFTYKIQDINRVPLGIASALQLAEDFTNGERFAVILGDNFFEDSFAETIDSFTRREHKAEIFLKSVPDPERFGVYFDGHIEEKPSHPRSNWAVTGLYLYTPDVYTVARSLELSHRGELEISDINQHYCQQGEMSVNYITGFWCDMGTPTSVRRTQKFIQQTGYKC